MLLIIFVIGVATGIYGDLVQGHTPTGALPTYQITFHAKTMAILW